MSNSKRRKFLKLAAASPVALLSLNQAQAALTTSMASAATASASADPWLEISLANMAWNIQQIKNRVNNRPVMGVIKGNAYGHGLVEIGRFLDKQPIDALAVGKAAEALALRQADIKPPLLNLGPFAQQETTEIVKQQISQSIYTDDFNWLAEAARTLNIQAKVHLKIDTGLGRVGVPSHQALPFIEKVAATKHIKIEGIFTPLTEDVEFDQVQLSRFLDVCNSAQQKGIKIGAKHVASSAAVIAFPDSHLDMIRPGIALYGQYPSTKEYQARRIELKPVMALKSRIAYLKTLRTGDAISYHRAFVADKETRVATVPTGYSDGYPYQLAGKGSVLIGGNRCPIIGLVTANHLTVDVSNVKNVKLGDEVVLFGKQAKQEITVEEVAAWSDTSVYKILIWMNPLLPRLYS